MTPAERALIALFKQDRAHCAARAQDDEIEGKRKNHASRYPAVSVDACLSLRLSVLTCLLRCVPCSQGEGMATAEPALHRVS